LNKIFGYKGQMEADAAVYYCPYIPGHPIEVDELEVFWDGVMRRLREQYRQEQTRLTQEYRNRRIKTDG